MSILDPLKEKLNVTNPVLESMIEDEENDDIDDETIMDSVIYGNDDMIDPELDNDLGEDDEDWDGSFLNDEEDD